MALLGDILLREVPDALIAGMASGDLKVHGSIIRSISSGRIVGHLQETSALSGLGNLLGGTASLPLQGLDLVGQTVAMVQNEQIKHAVAVVQQLQLANLALGAVGIGVSVAGTAVLWRKIDIVEKQVAGLAATLDALLNKVEALRQDRIADDLARLRAVADQMNEAWLLTDPVPQWDDVAREAHVLGSIFERRAVAIIEAGEHDPSVAEPMLAALGLASATRVAARLASGATVAAREAAAVSAETMANLTGHFGLGSALLKRMQGHRAATGSAAWRVALTSHAEMVRPLLTDQRDRVTALASSGLTIGEIDRQGIDGRAWLEAAREEKDAPLLCLQSRA